MSYVRCYDCGAKCPDPEFVRRDVPTHSGMRRVNLCLDCDDRRTRDAERLIQEAERREHRKTLFRLLGCLVCLGAPALCCGLGALLRHGPPTTENSTAQQTTAEKDKPTGEEEVRTGREGQLRKEEEERIVRQKAEQEEADRRRKQRREEEERIARECQERKEREKKAARLQAIVDRLGSDEAGEQLAALQEALPVAAELPEAAQARALELLKSSADPKVGAAAFAFLRARKAEKLALPVLLNHLDSENTVLRRRAVEMLARLRPTDPKVIAKLVDALDDKDTGLRAATTLGKIGKPAVAALRDHLKSDRPEARRYAVVALSYIGPDAADALPDLEAIADNDSSPAVRAAAHTAIKRIRGG